MVAYKTEPQQILSAEVDPGPLQHLRWSFFDIMTAGIR